MKEKLLQLLKTKFAGVQDATLDRIATKKGETATEETLQTIVDGINFSDVIQSEADYRATEASRTAVLNYEKKYKVKDGKTIETPAPDPPKTDTPKVDEMPAWAKALQDTVTTLAGTVSNVVKTNQVKSKQQQALESFKTSKVPEKLHQRWASRIDYEGETPVEDQIKALEAEYLETHQEIITTSVKDGTFVPGAPKKVEAAEMAEYLDEKFPTAQEK